MIYPAFGPGTTFPINARPGRFHRHYTRQQIVLLLIVQQFIQLFGRQPICLSLGRSFFHNRGKLLISGPAAEKIVQPGVNINFCISFHLNICFFKSTGNVRRNRNRYIFHQLLFNYQIYQTFSNIKNLCTSHGFKMLLPNTMNSAQAEG